MKTLLTDAHYDYTVAIIRYLAKKGIDVYTIGDSRKNLASLSIYCKNNFVGPNLADENAYAQFIIDLVKKNHFDLLIPISYKATKIISQNRKKIEKYTNLVIADSEKLENAFNKYRTLNIAEELGIPIPETFLIKTLDDLNMIAPKLRYPVVIKPSIEIGGGGCRYPKTQHELLSYYNELYEKYNLNISSAPMIQEYVNGDSYTYGFAALYQEGKCKNIFMHREIRSIPVTGGTGVYLESIYDNKLIEYGTKLLDSLSWHGVALVEFKKNAIGEYVLMEINAKIWASIEVALKAGCNLPYRLCQVAKGKKLSYSEEYLRNLKFHFIGREIAYLRKKPTTIPRIIFDTLNPKISSDFWFSDLKPSLANIFLVVLKISK